MNSNLDGTYNFGLLALNCLIPLIKIVTFSASDYSVLVQIWRHFFYMGDIHTYRHTNLWLELKKLKAENNILIVQAHLWEKYLNSTDHPPPVSKMSDFLFVFVMHLPFSLDFILQKESAQLKYKLMILVCVLSTQQSSHKHKAFSGRQSIKCRVLNGSFWLGYRIEVTLLGYRIWKAPLLDNFWLSALVW